MLYGVIIAGGKGKRLWPRSRQCFPKFLLKLDAKSSLLKDTVKRLLPLMRADNIFIVTNKDYVSLVKKDLPGFKDANIIAEPVSRNTAPAVCVAASYIYKKDPDAVLFVLPADQLMATGPKAKEVFDAAASIARQKDSIVTLGIKPSYPATGYGYIKAGSPYRRPVSKNDIEVFGVAEFAEKPSLKKAISFVKSKKYFWNSGIFIGKASVFLGEFRRHRPDIYNTARAMTKGSGAGRLRSNMARLYKKFADISIDYAIMEKTKKAYVVKAGIDWQDIGSWKSLEHYAGADTNGNIISGEAVCLDSEDSIISGEKDRLIALLGLKNVVVVQSGDATLVCSKERAEDVKKLVDILEKRKMLRYL